VSHAPFEVFAILYGQVSDRRPHDNFVVADPHEFASDLAYYVWVLRRGEEVYLVDTGFSTATAKSRGRTLLRCPLQALSLLGIASSAVRDVIITHLHYDHAGNLDLPAARYHLQAREMQFATGPCMCHRPLRAPMNVEDVVGMVRHVYSDRVRFHDGDAQLAPGLSLHLIGGHTTGLQCVRVWTERGWVVLASDACHLYANLLDTRPFPILVDMAAVLNGFETVKRLASSASHVIPGHDPLVMRLYPPPRPDLAGIVVRLDVEPVAEPV
jgi:glyoxylase-like metal-dependent hydrolase (beta-lactamase superfamily II)